MTTRDHILGWHHAAQLIADSMPVPVKPSAARLVPVTGRIGVPDIDPTKPSNPAKPKHYCDTCQDTGRMVGLVDGGREEEMDCCDCDGEGPPAALGDGWIDCSADMPDLKVGAYEMRNVSTEYRWTPNSSLLTTVEREFRDERYQFRLIPTEAA
jgi:hypothetical protein